MNAKPNLMVLRASNPDSLVTFYTSIGLSFVKERHGSGPTHFASASAGFVLEIYPCTSQARTSGLRLGFSVDDVDRAFAAAVANEGSALVTPRDSDWGRRAVVRDSEGHTVEPVERR